MEISFSDILAREVKKLPVLNDNCCTVKIIAKPEGVTGNLEIYQKRSLFLQRVLHKGCIEFCKEFDYCSCFRKFRAKLMTFLKKGREKVFACEKLSQRFFYNLCIHC